MRWLCAASSRTRPGSPPSWIAPRFGAITGRPADGHEEIAARVRRGNRPRDSLLLRLSIRRLGQMFHVDGDVAGLAGLEATMRRPGRRRGAVIALFAARVVPRLCRCQASLADGRAGRFQPLHRPQVPFASTLPCGAQPQSSPSWLCAGLQHRQRRHEARCGRTGAACLAGRDAGEPGEAACGSMVHRCRCRTAGRAGRCAATMPSCAPRRGPAIDGAARDAAACATSGPA